jgi:SnoaL-like domain
MESAMSDEHATCLTPEHRDFFQRFKSFWAAPSGPRVAELIAPDATIHFTGAGTFSGAEYVDVMAGMLGSMVDMTVTPLDCAGNGDRLYIAWETSALINGTRRTYLGVDRFRIANGMAIEEQVIFDSAVLQSAT